MSIRISAVICTLNRSHYLCNAIKSLDKQTLPKEDYEILIVDNGSTDDTKTVVCKEFGYLKNLRYIYEPVLGISRARNAGWRSAKGEYVAYMDDDVIATPNWLEKILYVFETAKPRPGCVGGQIKPMWPIPKPEWLSDEISKRLAFTAEEDNKVSMDNFIIGSSIAYPIDLIEIVGGFDTAIGHRGKAILSGEEIQFQEIIKEKGYNIMYHPDIVVEHHISAGKLTKKWFMRDAYWKGVAFAVVDMKYKHLSGLIRVKTLCAKVISVFLSPRKLKVLFMATNDPVRFQIKYYIVQDMGYFCGLTGLVK